MEFSIKNKRKMLGQEYFLEQTIIAICLLESIQRTKKTVCLTKLIYFNIYNHLRLFKNVMTYFF